MSAVFMIFARSAMVPHPDWKHVTHRSARSRSDQGRSHKPMWKIRPWKAVLVFAENRATEGRPGIRGPLGNAAIMVDRTIPRRYSR
jgi:hypothetical protein